MFSKSCNLYLLICTSQVIGMKGKKGKCEGQRLKQQSNVNISLLYLKIKTTSLQTLHRSDTHTHSKIYRPLLINSGTD